MKVIETKKENERQGGKKRRARMAKIKSNKLGKITILIQRKKVTKRTGEKSTVLPYSCRLISQALTTLYTGPLKYQRPAERNVCIPRRAPAVRYLPTRTASSG